MTAGPDPDRHCAPCPLAGSPLICPGREDRAYCRGCFPGFEPAPLPEVPAPPAPPAFPPLWKQAANAVVAVATHLAAGAEDAPPALTAARLAVCEACPSGLYRDGRCTDCGCHMPTKAGWRAMDCPKGHWPTPDPVS